MYFNDFNWLYSLFCDKSFSTSHLKCVVFIAVLNWRLAALRCCTCDHAFIHLFDEASVINVQSPAPGKLQSALVFVGKLLARCSPVNRCWGLRCEWRTSRWLLYHNVAADFFRQRVLQMEQSKCWWVANQLTWKRGLFCFLKKSKLKLLKPIIFYNFYCICLKKRFQVQTCSDSASVLANSASYLWSCLPISV